MVNCIWGIFSLVFRFKIVLELYIEAFFGIIITEFGCLNCTPSHHNINIFLSEILTASIYKVSKDLNCFDSNLLVYIYLSISKNRCMFLKTG